MKRLLNFSRIQWEDDVHDLRLGNPDETFRLIEVFHGNSLTIWDLIFQGEDIRRKKLLTKKKCKIWKNYPSNFPADSIFLFQKIFSQHFDPDYIIHSKEEDETLR